MIAIQIRALRVVIVAAAACMFGTSVRAQMPQDPHVFIQNVIQVTCQAISQANTASKVDGFVQSTKSHLATYREFYTEAKEHYGNIERDTARLAEENQLLQQRRSQSELASIESQIKTDQRIMDGAHQQAAALDASGVDGGPSLAVIQGHIAGLNAQINDEFTTAPERQADKSELENWTAKLNALQAAKADLRDNYKNAASDLAAQQKLLPAAQQDFDASTVQLRRQIDDQQGRIDNDRGSIDQMKKYGPVIAAEDTIVGDIQRCADERMAQLQPAPAVNGAPPQAAAAGGQPLKGNVTWSMNCAMDVNNIFTGYYSGQMIFSVDANGTVDGRGPFGNLEEVHVTGRMDPSGQVSGSFEGANGSSFNGSINPSTGAGAGNLAIQDSGAWGVCGGTWEFHAS